jgi:hypothetical protein
VRTISSLFCVAIVFFGLRRTVNFAKEDSSSSFSLLDYHFIFAISVEIIVSKDCDGVLLSLKTMLLYMESKLLNKTTLASSSSTLEPTFVRCCINAWNALISLDIDSYLAIFPFLMQKNCFFKQILHHEILFQMFFLLLELKNP